MDVAQLGALAHGHQSSLMEVIGGHFTGGQVLLVVFIHIGNCLSAFGLLDAVAVAVVDKGAGIGS